MEVDDVESGGARKWRPGSGKTRRGKRTKKSKGAGCRKLTEESVKEFGENTTFHGLRYVTNDKNHIFRRFVWLLVVVSLTTLLGIDVVRAVIRMFEYPERSSISVHYPPNITFPAVTLCNINMFRSDSLSPSQIELLASVFSDPERIPGIDWYDLNLTDKVLFPSSNESQVIDTLVTASHRIEDMLLSCRWLAGKCSPGNFTRRLTDQGVCYTFNDPTSSEGEPLEVRSPGSRKGLFMRLDVQQHLYTYGESYAAGVKVLLHQQGEYPMVKDFAFSLSPGFETSVVVRKRVMENLKAPYRSNCTDSYGGKFPFKYTAASCQYACKINYVTGKCRCRDYRWPGSEPICSLDKQVNCIYQYEGRFLSGEGRCNCPIACETITYGREMSIAYWPASYLSEDLQLNQNLTEEFIRKNFLEVRIYFEEIMYTETVQSGAYTLATLQSDIGGYLGLLCGMSLMTLVELADLILVTLFKKLKR